jgi:succinate dehydrogenase / fumarate reductase membrane anchor subunit
MSLRTSLGRARGSGAAKDGSEHWWQQRVTAVALVPLSVWFLASVVSLSGANLEQFRAWLAVPCNTALAIFFLLVVFHHGQLGMQVVIEDYVHNRAVKLAGIIGVKLLAAWFAIFSVVAVLRAAFVGA